MAKLVISYDIELEVYEASGIAEVFEEGLKMGLSVREDAYVVGRVDLRVGHRIEQPDAAAVIVGETFFDLCKRGACVSVEQFAAVSSRYHSDIAQAAAEKVIEERASHREQDKGCHPGYGFERVAVLAKHGDYHGGHQSRIGSPETP